MTNQDVDAFLAHYGVKGMKWGVRNDKKSSGTPKIGVVDPVSVAAAATFVGIMGVRGIHTGIESGKFRSSVTRGKKFMSMNSEYWDKKPDLASKTYSADEIHKKVLPGINPKYPSNGASMNCRRATFAYEMRRRGYDVEATKTTIAHGGDGTGLTKALGMKGAARRNAAFNVDMNGGGDHNIGSGDGKAIFNRLSKEPERSRGEVVLTWGGPVPGIPGGAHSVAYEVINGKAHIFDAQSGAKYDQNSPVFLNSVDASYTRLDDKDLSQKHLTKWLK